MVLGCETMRCFATRFARPGQEAAHSKNVRTFKNACFPWGKCIFLACRSYLASCHIHDQQHGKLSKRSKNMAQKSSENTLLVDVLFDQILDLFWASKSTKNRSKIDGFSCMAGIQPHDPSKIGPRPPRTNPKEGSGGPQEGPRPLPSGLGSSPGPSRTL